MNYIVTNKGTEHELPLGELRHQFECGNFAGKDRVRGVNQDFTYRVDELLGIKALEPISFLCVKCRQMVKAKWVDMQLALPCPNCGELIVVPDRRSPYERAATKKLKEAKGESNYRIIAGVIMTLIGAALVAAMVLNREGYRGSGGEPGKIVLYPIGIGMALLITGLRGRAQRRREAARKTHQITGTKS